MSEHGPMPDADLPLAGIRVLDLTRLLPGGFCSLLLADYGADVLKVEDTAAGDYIRWAPPLYDGAAHSAASRHAASRRLPATSHIQGTETAALQLTSHATRFASSKTRI